MDGGGLEPWCKRYDRTADEGCAFILDSGGRCGAARQPGSSYCEPHHLLCHLPGGSAGEKRRLREVETLASAVGGRGGRHERVPPERYLQRLEMIARGSVRPNCSCIVRRNGGKA